MNDNVRIVESMQMPSALLKVLAKTPNADEGSLKATVIEQFQRTPTAFLQTLQQAKPEELCTVIVPLSCDLGADDFRALFGHIFQAAPTAFLQLLLGALPNADDFRAVLCPLVQESSMEPLSLFYDLPKSFVPLFVALSDETLWKATYELAFPRGREDDALVLHNVLQGFRGICGSSSIDQLQCVQECASYLQSKPSIDEVLNFLVQQSNPELDSDDDDDELSRRLCKVTFLCKQVGSLGIDQTKSGHSRTPLHLAAKDCHWKLVALVFSAGRQAALMHDSFDLVPIRPALSAKNYAATVLLKSYSPDVFGAALERNVPTHVLKMLWKPTFRGLVTVLESVVSDELALQLIDSSPSELFQTLDLDTGNCLLHFAAEHNRSLAVLKKVAAKYPEGVTIVDHDGLRPVHKLVQKGMSDDDIERLQVVSGLDSGGWTVSKAFSYMQSGFSQVIWNTKSSALDSSNVSALHLALRYGDASLGVGVAKWLLENDEYLKTGTGSYKGEVAFPLQIAVSNPKLSTEVVGFLVDLNPSILHLVDENGNLALHVAAITPATKKETVRLLIKHNPSALIERNYDGNLPLFLAMDPSRGSCCPEVIELLKESNRSALIMSNYAKWSALHFVCANAKTLPIDFLSMFVEELIDVLPSALGMPYKENGTNQTYPLHLLLGIEHISDALLVKCVERCPEALKLTDSNGNSPLHLFAARPTLAPNDLQSFVDAYPQASQVQNNSGDVPLRVVLSNKQSQHQEANFQILFQVYPGAASASNNDGRLPLHDAFIFGAPETIIKTLVAQNREVLQKPDTDNFLPVHYACMHLHTFEYMLDRMQNNTNIQESFLDFARKDEMLGIPASVKEVAEQYYLKLRT